MCFVIITFSHQAQAPNSLMSFTIHQRDFLLRLKMRLTLLVSRCESNAIWQWGVSILGIVIPQIYRFVRQGPNLVGPE
jgi:hypothetical protein